MNETELAQIRYDLRAVLYTRERAKLEMVFGQLYEARRLLRINYEYEQTSEWRDKVRAFLGIDDDTNI